ncbi:MAG: hypothetical protein LBJ73_02345 [Rickettsiales bacterium]|jgi:hypothetical protein|nr:hypothetical protein [Rickettsiales bacterium]
MQKIKIYSLFFILFSLCATASPLHAAAAKAKTQSAVQKGTNVRAKVAPSGLYSQECYDTYYGCMDQFCIPDNGDGGSCMCSDDHAKYEKQLEDIKQILTNANDISTVEVERIKAGAQADIIFNGSRQYDEKGNVLSSTALSTEDIKAQKKKDLLAKFESTLYDDDEDIWEDGIDGLASKTGSALYNSAHQLCTEQMPATCSKDITILSQIYSTQIKSDCKGFENDVANKKLAAEQELASANADVRAALKQSFDEANKYDRGTCMVEFKKCMQTTDACGSDWSNCVSTIASENMQNQKAVSTAGSTVKTVDKYEITNSTMEILEAKRNICESVLNSCVAVRDMVWPDFLREAAPTIKVAELNAESKMRQSCLTDISDCIQKACKDDIVGKGVETMDSCLSRPEMARSFCKVQVDSCERMEPLIWGYVKDKLAAMRVDACTAEVKECFTAEDRCGSDYSNCIGMDYDYIHDICPIDKLVVCKANNPKFSMADLDSMLMGLYLNIDNSALDTCQEKVDLKMAEVCGSTTDCNKFATDDTMGTGSLRAQKDGNIYRVTGMISFGSIKMGDATARMTDKGAGKTTKLGPGEIGVQDYLETVREKNASVPNAEGIMSSIEEELNHIAGTINRTIEMIEQDPEIQFCVSGRNLEQITGKAKQKTTARFPNLLNQVKMQIAIAALRQANNNYNQKLNTEIANATKDASADLAQYMCQRISATGGEVMGTSTEIDTPLAPPYAISYDVGLGLNASELLTGGKSTSEGGKISSDFSTSGADFASLTFGTKKHKFEAAGVTREMWSIFSRDTRNCHFCTSTVTQSCKTKKSNGFLGIGGSNSTECTTGDPVEKCEDIAM